MRNTRLGDQIKIMPGVVPTAGSVTSLTAVEVNGTGYDRALWIIQTGAIAATGKLDVKIEDAVLTGMGSPADITSAALTQVATAGSSKIFTIDHAIKASRPFIMVVGAVTTDTAANSVVCILYRASSVPVATTYATQAIVV